MLLWILGPVLGPHFGGTPLDGVPGYGVFPLAYKGLLHYTLPGDGPKQGYPISVSYTHLRAHETS